MCRYRAEEEFGLESRGGREAEGGGGVSIMLCEGDASPSLSPFFGYRDRGYGV